MAENERFLKPQSPIQDGEDYILPITSYDQIIMPDGVSRWDGVSGSAKKTVSDIEGLEDVLASAGKVKTVNNKEADESGNIELSALDIGAAKSVNNKEADENGNVELTAEDIGAMPSTFGSGENAVTIEFSEDGALVRKDADGNEYAIYDEGNKPTAADVGALSINLDGDVVDGTGIVKINADTLQGMTFDQLKEAIMAEAVYQ